MNILIVDDEKNIRRSLELILTGEGFKVNTTGTASDARTEIVKRRPDIIFLDVLLPDENGLDLLKEIRQQYPGIEVVMISGHATLSMAVEATKSGAYDFLEKPLQKEKILLTVNHLQEKRFLHQQYEKLHREISGEYEMVGESPAIRQILEQIRKVAETDSKVLIRGESGTGKELVAWAIHHLSSRRKYPFVKMNCAAIPEELTESELFGHQKGSFTGASATTDGKFLQADKGTLFLDEVGDMSLRVQTKVLRVLQDGTFERTGGSDTISVDVRVIAATNKDLEKMVQAGEFRQDLYFRLNVFPVTVPPLRRRADDIPLLINHFLTRFCLKNNRRPVSVDLEVVEILKAYRWPGNVRELQNVVERLLILSEGDKIGIRNLPQHLLAAPETIPDSATGTLSLKEVREKAERQFIEACLKKCSGNVSEAARMMGIERTNLHKKIKALKIDLGS
jgi:two-component system nitrogen regulation response regulator NtrX